jgi:hypothetical protein
VTLGATEWSVDSPDSWRDGEEPLTRVPGQELSVAVARGGVEPPTYRFSVGRSYQLSYLAEPGGMDLPVGDPDGTRTRGLRRDRAAR